MTSINLKHDAIAYLLNKGLKPADVVAIIQILIKGQQDGTDVVEYPDRFLIQAVGISPNAIRTMKERLHRSGLVHVTQGRGGIEGSQAIPTTYAITKELKTAMTAD